MFLLKFLEEGFLCLNFGSTFKGTEKKLVSRLDWLVCIYFKWTVLKLFNLETGKVHLEVNSLENFNLEDEKSENNLFF